MLTVNEHLRALYGEKVYKLALSAVTTCPNRDGRLGTRGCLFCGEEGAGSFAEPRAADVSEQIERAKRRIAKKTDARLFIAYFQSFTNTYAPIDYLERVFTEAILHPDVVILSIATRPDCLPPEVLSLLARLASIKPVWVELGLQTMHESTARHIRRGYPLSVYSEAVRALKAIGVTVVTHMILGLPGETPEMMAQTAAFIGNSGADGIKLQLLHVLEGTDLEEEYRSGAFRCLTLEEYLDCLEGCLSVLPREMVIHRLTGDGDKRRLLSPLWSADKKRVLNAIRRRFQAITG